MRKLVEQRIRTLWQSGYDEGLSRAFAEPSGVSNVKCEQTADCGYAIELADRTYVRLTRLVTDANFDCIVNRLSDSQLIAWLEHLLCQKYR